MIFYKSVSSGNDFIHVDMEQLPAPAGRSFKAGLAVELCHRHTGGGADGIIYYRTGKDTADFEIYNRDGSEAEISGNGMAGLSALLFFLEKFSGKVTLNTRIGTRVHQLLERKQNSFRLKVEIGSANFEDKEFFPFLQTGKSAYDFQGITFYPVSVGNPHVVIISSQPNSEEVVASLCKTLADAEIFPQKTNVEYLYPGKTGTPIRRVFYYERGVGKTLSSSTGSAAVFAVLNHLGEIDDSLTLQTAQETFKITGRKKIYIENSTKIVYKGIYLNLTQIGS